MIAAAQSGQLAPADCFAHVHLTQTMMPIGLFENGRDTNIKSTIAMVEDVLLELGYFLNNCRDDETTGDQRSWTIRKGSALVNIYILAPGDNVEHVHLRAVSVVMTITPNVDEGRLLRYVLEVNRQEVTGAAFALDDNRLLLVAERPTLDLDRSEVFDLIQRVRMYADEYDDLLVNRFGGVLGTGD